MKARRPVALVAWDPQLERATVLVRTMAWVLTASFIAAVAMSLLNLAETTLGRILVGAAALVGTFPAIAHARRSRYRERLSIYELPRPAAGLVSDAVDQCKRLDALATAAPPGPVADHLQHLATTADRYAVAIHSSLCQVHRRSGDNNTELGDQSHEIRQLVGQLTELANAATELRQVQRRHLEPSPLETLTEDTRRLSEGIATTHGLSPETP